MPTTKDTLFIRIASERQLLTKEQIAECREIQKTLRQVREEKSLLEIAINKRYVSKEQAAKLEELLERDGLPKKLGEFEIISKIGKGGMGAVYKARQASMARDVALKVLPVDLSQDESLISRFHREAKSVGRLNHPNVVIGIAAGEAEGHHYFAMEYVEGEDLSSILAKRGKSGKGNLEVREAIDVILQVSRGLAAAHEQNIIHRDIKPANVLITKDGTAKLADLGLAKRLNVEDMSFVTQTGQMMGTPYYMSPEQITDPKSVDQRSDIYSLGAMFYHVLTGELPYSGESVYEVIQKHQTAPVPWPDEKNPEVPMVVCEIVQRMLAKLPEDRYQSLGQVIQGLEAFIEGTDSPAQVEPNGVSGKEAYVIPEEEIAGLEDSLKQRKPASSAQRAHQKKEAEVSVATAGIQEDAETKARLSRRAVIVSASGLIAFLAMAILIAVVFLHKPKDKLKPTKGAKATKHRQTPKLPGDSTRESRPAPTPLPNGLLAKPGSKIDKDTVEPEIRSATKLFDEPVAFEEDRTEEHKEKKADTDAEKLKAMEAARTAEEKWKAEDAYYDIAYQIDCLLADRKYDDAEKICDEGIGKLADDAKKQLLTARLDQMNRIKSFWAAAEEGAKELLVGRDLMLPFKTARIKCKVKGVKDGKLILSRPGRSDMDFSLTKLESKEALRLARHALKDATNEKHLTVAAFLVAERQFKEARSELELAGQSGIDIQRCTAALEAVEERLGKTKLDAEAQEMYSRVKALYEADEPFKLRELVKELKEKYPEARLWRHGDEQDPPLSKILEITKNLGDVIIVRKDEKGDYTTIQAAVDAVKKPNSMVEIQDSGTYKEVVVIKGEERDGLRLRGTSGKWPLIDGEGRPSCVGISVNSAMVRGICFQNLGDENARTIVSEGMSRLSLRDNIFTSNAVRALGSSGLDIRLQGNLLILLSLTMSTMEGHRIFLKGNVLTGGLDIESSYSGIENNVFYSTNVMFSGQDMKVFKNTIPIVMGLQNVVGFRSLAKWTFRDSIAGRVSVQKREWMEVGNIAHCCFYGQIIAGGSNYMGSAKHGVGCISADPMFLDPENFDFRLHRNSPCRGAASDGGDIGARITPHILQMLRLAKAILENDGRVTQKLLDRYLRKNYGKASKQGKKLRSRKTKR